MQNVAGNFLNADFNTLRRMGKLKTQTKDLPLLEALKAEALKACFRKAEPSGLP